MTTDTICGSKCTTLRKKGVIPSWPLIFHLILLRYHYPLHFLHPLSEHDLPADSEPSSSSDDGYTLLQANKVLSGALKYPSPVSKQRPEVGEKVTARVLTSIDSLRAMEEKRRKRGKNFN